METLAIDFGTTNTVTATPDGEASEAVRTALAFQRAGPGETIAGIGPRAIEMFLDDPENTRFLQSFKSFAASASFTGTQIFNRRLAFEHLLRTFLGGLTAIPKRIVMGRPVTFAGQNPDDALAMTRYAAALKALGAEDVLYVHEPVAAAYFYAQRLTEPATVLVGDFGGGTSDFSLLRFSGKGQVAALGQSGVGIAGDRLDYRILEHVVTPRLGKGGHYVSWGKRLAIPAHYFASFARWNELCLMNRPQVLTELRGFARASPVAKELEALIALIEGGESYGLYQAVSKAKSQLSAQERIDFRFECHGIAIAEEITRADFETWIAGDVKRMMTAAEGLLAKTGQRPDRVFLTGGTSFVPLIRHTFAERFGADKIETGDELISIAKGLALIGAAPDAERWGCA